MLAVQRAYIPEDMTAVDPRLWTRGSPTSAYGRQLEGWGALGELGQLPGLDTILKVSKAIFYIGVGTAIITISIFVFRLFDTFLGP
jgi:hypothetical protein